MTETAFLPRSGVTLCWDESRSLVIFDLRSFAAPISNAIARGAGSQYYYLNTFQPGRHGLWLGFAWDGPFGFLYVT